MRLFLNIAVWLAVIAFCVLMSYAAIMLSILLIALIHESGCSPSMIDSIIIFASLVVCGIVSLVLGHGIGETRHGK